MKTISLTIVAILALLIIGCAQTSTTIAKPLVSTRTPRTLPPATKFARAEKTPTPCFPPLLILEGMENNSWIDWDKKPVDLGGGWNLTMQKNIAKVFFAGKEQLDGPVFWGGNGIPAKNDSISLPLWQDREGIHGIVYVFQCPDGTLKYNIDFMWKTFSRPGPTPGPTASPM